MRIESYSDDRHLIDCAALSAELCRKRRTALRASEVGGDALAPPPPEQSQLRLSALPLLLAEGDKLQHVLCFGPCNRSVAVG